MSLSEQARSRLQDVRELEPTSNGELRERWGMHSGSEVASFLNEELGEYTYRDGQSRVRTRNSDEILVEDADDDAEGALYGIDDSPADPDDEERGIDPDSPAEPQQTGSRQDSQGVATGAEAEESEKLEIAAAEAESQGYEAGQEDGYVRGQIDAHHGPDREPVEVESTVRDVEPTGRTCPECGDGLNTDVEGVVFFAVGGKIAVLEQGDGLCESCDVVVSEDEKMIYGNESDKADPKPTCSECSALTIVPDHALYIIGQYRRETSSVRVFSQRKLEKIARGIKQGDAEAVCPNCWLMYE